MMSILRASLLIAGGAFLVSQAKAEDAPADTATFVTYCSDHFEVCRKEVLDVNNINMMQLLGGNHGCSFPHTAAKTHGDSITATKAILVWLNTNATSRAPKTYDAIEQATKALWPSECR
jgi:hypothetical protein